MYLFARNEELNEWLGQNPVVLGGIFLVLGFVLSAFGIAALTSGRSTTKYGRKLGGR